MGDPILGIKWFCLFAVLWVLLFIAYIVAKSYRLSFAKIKFFASNTEACILIAIALDTIAAVLCLIWSVIAWIIS